MNKKYFVTSDVHSFFDELMAALKKNGFEIDNPDHVLCICGDLFDRGNQTVELFEFVKMLQDQSRLIYVAGNHESLLFDCMTEIYNGKIPDSHHFSNGTIKTICQFCGQGEWIIYDPTWRDKICETMQPVLDFISDNCIDYAEIGDHILVHGWIPVTAKDGLPYYYTRNRKFEFNSDWINANEDEWEQARWLNGMEMWKNVGHPKGKIIVCGHWHCSWGWSYLKQERKEFPNKSLKDWKRSFEPFVDDGIIAIDACTAYSGLCNVIVIEK